MKHPDLLKEWKEQEYEDDNYDADVNTEANKVDENKNDMVVNNRRREEESRISIKMNVYVGNIFVATKYELSITLYIGLQFFYFIGNIFNVYIGCFLIFEIIFLLFYYNNHVVVFSI